MDEMILTEKGLVVRHSMVELIEHWAIAISGLILFVTGIFELPSANRYYITSVPGFAWSSDFITSLYIHYVAAIVFTAAVIFHLVYHGLRGEKGMIPQKGDMVQSVIVIKSLFGFGEEPPMPKYLPEQRLAYVGMAFIIAMLIISGLIKTYKNIYAPDMSLTIVLWATWIHNIFFILFFLAFLSHMAAIALRPNWPMVRGIFTGKVRLDYARHRHSLWFAEINFKEKYMNKRKRIIVIGGSASGPKAAAKARRIDNNAEVIIIQKDADLSMASCGYPYYVGGYFDDRNMLLCTPTGVTRNPLFYLNAKDIDAKVNTEVTSIDRKNHSVSFKNMTTGEVGSLPYDKLVIATGSVPRLPPVPGVELEGITTLQSMKDADFLRKVTDDGKIKKAVVIGGGLIGIETCEALQLANIEITVIELLPQLLTFLDIELAKLVENHVKSKGANVITDNGIAAFLGENGKLTAVKLQNGTELPCELAVVAIGVRPNVKLAQEAGLRVGALGGLDVNEYMQTSDPDIYAVGDCVETVNRITGKKVLAPYGDLANLQGRVAGENSASENCVTFPGTIQTGICKVFDYAAGATGLSETTAKRMDYLDIITVINASPDKPGFMAGKLLVTKLVADRKTGKVLGAQCIGPGNVSKQIAQWAMAIQGKLTVEDIINADLPYAPPFSLAIDHFIATAHIMQNKMKGRLKGISCKEVREKVLANEKPFLIDTRGPEEFEEMRLGIGETLIPLGALRKRLKELPEDKEKEIICYCKISLRGYEAALALEGNGWKNVKVMEGGIMAWPYPREK